MNQDFDEDIKEVWKETRTYWQKEYANVNSKENIFSYVENFKILVEKTMANKQYLNRFQQTDMMQRLYYVVASIEKAISCYDNLNCNFNFTKKEIEDLFTEINVLVKNMEAINALRMMQD